ncbi:ATP-binding protein [Rhodoferax sp.]|uniref:sensor histidine kinase n=1 Tax=Rhodoferax sp. TaxID=50421 RepID=UPI00261E4F21|nr:ATP-binding protein [Rhodoferax sp.]MDD2924160.1 ATP-binding protein [Rhodoferax sp.]
MNSLTRLLFGEKNQIGRRLIVLIIAFSTVITLFISVVQLAFEYRGLRKALDRELDGIAIYVPTIAGSVWDFDEKQIQRAIDALILLPDLVEVRVIAADTARAWVSRKVATPNVITRRYALLYENRGRVSEIGALEVVSSLDGIYQQLLNSAVSIVLSNGVKTLLVALFMVVLIRRLITTRLENLANKVHALVPGMLPLRQAVETHPQPMPDTLDELDAVEWTLDQTAADLKVAVAALNQLNQDLESRIVERTKELESFSYSVSHDLRTPLRAIDGFSKMLMEDYKDKLDDEGKRLLCVVRGNTERMGQLIDDILQFSRLGRQQLALAPVDMERLVRTVFAELQPWYANRDVRLSIGALPPTLADASLLRQVLINLLSNAIKFTLPREVATIEVTGTEDGPHNVFCVRDNGVGFDMQYVDKLFGVFERLHSSDEFEGTGIGLAIVRQIVVRHGGKVWAEGKLDNGAAFCFTLPHP